MLAPGKPFPPFVLVSIMWGRSHTNNATVHTQVLQKYDVSRFSIYTQAYKLGECRTSWAERERAVTNC